MFDEVTAETALAEMQTPPEDLRTAIDSVEAETMKMAGPSVKRLAVATSEDGGPARCPQLVDDCENTVFEGKSSRLRVGRSCGANVSETVN